MRFFRAYTVVYDRITRLSGLMNVMTRRYASLYMNIFLKKGFFYTSREK